MHMKNNNASKQLREAIRILERKLGVLDENELTCCGVTMAQCHALVEIGRAASISLNDLAALLNLENSTMSRTVNNLVAGELVKRDIDPKDRRYVTISLAEKGVLMFNQIENGMDTYYEKIYASIPEEKREQVVESLQLVLDAMDQKDCCNVRVK